MEKCNRRRLRSYEHTYYHCNPFEYEDALIELIDMASKPKYADSKGDAFLVFTPDLPRDLPDLRDVERFRMYTSELRREKFEQLRREAAAAVKRLKDFVEDS